MQTGIETIKQTGLIEKSALAFQLKIFFFKN